MTKEVVPDPVRALLRTRRTFLADVDLGEDAPERVLARGDASGTMQLYELVLGDLVELTSLPEPVASAHDVPGARQAVLAIDEGGNERHQLYLIDLDDAAGATVEGFDRLRMSPATPSSGTSSRESRPMVARSRTCQTDPTASTSTCGCATSSCRAPFAARGWRLVSASLGLLSRWTVRVGAASRPRPLDFDLVLVDVISGEPRIPVPHPSEAALVGPPAWVSDSVFYASSNAGREFAGIVRHDLDAAEATTVPGTGERFDAEVVSAGAAIIVIEYRDGASTMWRYDTQTGERGGDIPLPDPG